MAINLWKLAGKPLAYSPLPLGSNSITIPLYGEYKVSFRAKSSSLATLRVTSFSSVNDLHVDQVLTSDFKDYSFSWREIQGGIFYLIDQLNRGDIIIESIELVQKPLSKLTINGIDSFNSGKWTLHANARVIDAETLELNATSQWANNQLNVTTVAGQVYTLTCETDNPSGAYYMIADVTTGNTTIAEGVFGSNKLIRTFTATGTVTQVRFKNALVQSVRFTKPMLNLGSIPAPYERKKGDKMVVPVPVGNIVPLLSSATFVDVVYSGDVFTVTSDSSVRLIANTSNPSFKSLFIAVKPNTSYVFTATSNGNIACVTYKANQSTLVQNSGWKYNTPIPFTTGAEEVFVKLMFGNGSTSGTFNFTNIQLELGTTPTPYKPYAVQVNSKPKKYVAKKNMFDGQLILGDVNTSGVIVAATDRYIPKNPPRIQSGKSYVLSRGDAVGTDRITIRDINGSVLTTGLAYSSFTAPIGAYDVIWRHSTNSVLNTTVQLEEGSATPYEPYQLTLPQAKTGTSFNGTTDYVQLPSMTMDSIEIDCLIDSVQPGGTNVYVDARTGLTNGFVANNGAGGIGSGFTTFKVNGINGVSPDVSIPKNQRVKILLGANSPFTDDVTIFARYTSPLYLTKGTLYKVTCYLAGNIVAQYDFENPSNIVGDKVLQSAKNIVPSFEDARWSLHVNSQVLGKDYLRLVASANNQRNDFYLNVTPSSKFYLSGNSNGLMQVFGYDSLGVQAYVDFNGINKTHTIPSNVVSLRVSLTNGTLGSTGTFDFIKPQLYQLSNEATLFGKPVPLRKASKRSLYAKR